MGEEDREVAIQPFVMIPTSTPPAQPAGVLFWQLQHGVFDGLALSIPTDRSYLEQRVVPQGAKLVDYSKQGTMHWLLIEVVAQSGDSLSRDFVTEDDGTDRFIALVLSRQDRSEPR